MGHDFKFEVIPLEQVADKPQVLTENQQPVVLVVDDEPLIVDSLAAILANVGLTVLKAYDGPSALEVAMSSPPHLLVTDVAMPGMNGIELAMTVARSLPTCRVLLFSGHASQLDLTPAREAGFDFPLLSKPIHPREMVSRVFASLQAQPRQQRTRRHEAAKNHFQWLAPHVSA